MLRFWRDGDHINLDSRGSNRNDPPQEREEKGQKRQEAEECRSGCNSNADTRSNRHAGSDPGRNTDPDTHPGTDRHSYPDAYAQTRGSG